MKKQMCLVLVLSIVLSLVLLPQTALGKQCSFVTTSFATDNIVLYRDGTGTQVGNNWNGNGHSLDTEKNLIKIAANKNAFLAGDARYAMPGTVQFELDVIPTATTCLANVYVRLVNKSGVQSQQGNPFRDVSIIQFSSDGKLVINAAYNGTKQEVGDYTANERYTFKVLLNALTNSYTVTLVSGKVDGEDKTNTELGGASFADTVFAFCGFLFYNNAAVDYYVDHVKVTALPIDTISSTKLSKNKLGGYSAEVETQAFDVSINQFIDVTVGTPLVVKKRAVGSADFTTLTENTDYTLTWGISSESGLTGNPAAVMAWKAKPTVTLTAAGAKGDEYVFDFSGAKDAFGRTLTNAKLEFMLGEPENVQEQVEAVQKDIVKVVQNANTDVDFSAVTADLVLPTTGENDTIITWSASSDETVLKTDGTVSRPHYDATTNRDTEVTLSGTVSKQGVSVPITLTVTVKMLDLSEDFPTLDMQAVSLVSEIDDDMERLTLPQKGEHGTLFSWSSSNTAAIDNYGLIHRSEKSQLAILTVRAVTEEGTDIPISDKSFTFIVPAKKTVSTGTTVRKDSGGSRGSIYVAATPTPTATPIATPEATPIATPTPEATPTPDETAAFADVQSETWDWARESIAYLAEQGVINGDENKMFRPDEAVTREEFIKMAVCAFAIEMTDTESSFADVAASQWYAPYIAAAQAGGITQGEGETFGVGRDITRQDMAVMIVRAAALKNETSAETADFEDNAEIADYAREAVAALTDIGAVSGYEDGTFRPQHRATRAETAKILYTVLQQLNKQ